MAVRWGGRAGVVVALLTTALIHGSDARAQCNARSLPVASVASEARRARWLIGDDARFQALLDDERHRFADTMKLLNAEERKIQVFAATAFAFQTVWPFEVCTNGGSASGSFERMRGAATVGLTHPETGLHARLSVVGALDQLNVSTSEVDDDATNARAGTHQLLVAGRFGHHRWLNVILGYVGGESAFNQTGTGNVNLVREKPRSGTHGAFVGASIPIIHTSVVTLVQEGRTELFSVLAHDLRPAHLPFTFSLGPTYIREERQTVGLVRFRSLSHESVEIDREDFSAEEGFLHHGASLEHVTIGPSVELSAESRDARIRHGRFRVQADSFGAFGGTTKRRLLHGSIYGEGTFFRSRFFSESFATATQAPRGTAWGVGGGLAAGITIAPLSLSFDGHVGVNRPELLSLLPSAADRPEARFGLSIRVEN